MSDGLRQRQQAYDDQHGIVRDATGRILSRRPLVEVIREHGLRRQVSMYETPGFVAWQTSKRWARARWLLEQAEDVERTASKEFTEDGGAQVEVIHTCVGRARAAVRAAHTAFETAHQAQAGADREDEYAYERTLALHCLASDAVQDAQAALDDARAVHERLRRS